MGLVCYKFECCCMKEFEKQKAGERHLPDLDNSQLHVDTDQLLTNVAPQRPHAFYKGPIITFQPDNLEIIGNNHI